MDIDWYLASVLIFVAVLAIWIYKDRKNFTRQSIFLLRKTQRGRSFIVSVGTRFPRGWKAVGFVSVVVGFIVSVLGFNMLLENVIKSILVKQAAPSLALLLPSPTAKAVTGPGFLAVPFWYWIICIALLALIHEGMHGIMAAREKVKIKSMGWGILAVIPLAFVEPDEKKLEKKGVWPQLRVFSAGSFGNFLLALLTFVIILALVNSIYAPSGVAFGYASSLPYPAEAVGVSGILKIGDSATAFDVSGIAQINETIGRFGENDTLKIETLNATFYIKKGLLSQQLKSPAGKPDGTLILFKDYPAAIAGMEGVVIKIDQYGIKDPADLSEAMEKIGPGRTITVTTRIGEQEKEFTVTTGDKPEQPAYQPDSWIYIGAALEHAAPGTIEFFHSAAEGWAGMTGQRVAVTWDYIQYRISLWQWTGKNYPLIKAHAESRTAYWQGQLQDRSRPGFLGIIGVISDFTLKAGLEPFREPLDFLQGLLFFLFIVNLGVGIVNLLPLKPLDGGRMWEIALKRYLPEKIAKKVVMTLGLITLALFILNFFPIGALF